MFVSIVALVIYFVKFAEKSSHECTSTCGVPQGGNPSPLTNRSRSRLGWSRLESSGFVRSCSKTPDSFGVEVVRNHLKSSRIDRS